MFNTVSIQIKNISFILALTICLMACVKNNNYQKATIIGVDYRECGCCGGTFIEIDNETYRFFEKIGFVEDELPLDIEVKWHPNDPACLGDEIIIDDFEL